MTLVRTLRVAAVVAATGLLAAACSSLDSSSSSSSPAAADTAAASGPAASGAATGGTIKIGYVTPLTGALAAFGEGDQWVVDQMTAYFAEHPIEAGGTSYGVDIIVKDSQSDPKRAGELAGELINTDGVDILMAHATPETTVPVSAQCEANATPCITADTPWQPWVAGMGGNPGDPSTAFTWAYHFFWGLEDIAAVNMEVWDQVDTNKRVAALYPNDADGQAFTDEKTGYPAMIGPRGYTWNNPGLYPSGTQDFSSQIAAFKADDDQILTGIVPPPDFANFWKQAKQQGYNPKVVTVGKAIEFPAAIESLGDLAQNLATEVWWTPTYPTTSSLTGLSSQEFADQYTKDTGKQWNVTLGFSESLFETAAAAITAAGGPDKQKVADAMKTMAVSTLVGNLDWAKGPFPNVAKTPLVGGQWRQTDGGQFPYDLVVVSNEHAKEQGLDVPLGGKVEPLS
ncbi:MAG: ABC transporter substrate-binding protein [Candidatus Nanopelagicales bacterium]|jgi:branched-chain amino acid transport system substrate-binding protein